MINEFPVPDKCSECGGNLRFVNEIEVKNVVSRLYQCTSCKRLCVIK